jgi:type II secretory pathway predicted ATPase ExeA
MSIPVQRPVEFDQHPLVQQTYILPTTSIDDAFRNVLRCIRHRIPGAMLVGMSRYGKTYAGRYISLLLQEQFPKLVVVSVGTEKKKAPIESAFFENLLEAVGHKDLKSGTNSAKRRRLVQRLCELVSHSGRNLLIMFMDEAQRLHADEYEWLRDVHDKLEKNGIRMITFLIGQRKLVNQKNAFKLQGEDQIVARFMVEEVPFHGVRTAEDVATCLQAYDETRFPPESPWPYTRFFLPTAFDNGLRLVDQAANAWRAFTAAHQRAGFRFDIEIPMQYFSRVVEIVLTDCNESDAEDFALTPAIWDQAVQDSRYVVAVEELRLNPELDG